MRGKQVDLDSIAERKLIAHAPGPVLVVEDQK